MVYVLLRPMCYALIWSVALSAARCARCAPRRLQQSRVMASRDSSDAFIQHTPPKKRMSSPPAKLTSEAARALWTQLGNKCLYVSAVSV